ncbi:HAD family hydrolase [Streptomyces capoamus]|uniref:Glycerol-3-phosphatase n=1 Tax=Streptomyces capoamus TaxID=68183 RepID=A0A919EUQ9_9ACTN|nr:HAD-IA family hydrolase [Streptomyces capoamus]GGW13853.1 glycerol-3-phosphatase [Streptomyces libani subsp. rufus]GHG40704.1 glycerol-3-phosphatase [Streptomyces capoamus]
MAVLHDAVLFDLDGTLVDSYGDAEDCWNEWAASVGLGETFDLAPFYGQKRADIIRTLLPHLPQREIEEHAEKVRLAERARVSKVVALPGAARVLAALPPERWAIVTSNDTEVAQARLRSAGLPVPEVIVSADNVVHPKPHPEGFLLGAEKLGFKPASVVGIDDSPIGVTAAKEAGMTVVAVRFRHDVSELQDAHVIADGVDAIQFEVQPDGILLTIDGEQR